MRAHYCHNGLVRVRYTQWPFINMLDNLGISIEHSGGKRSLTRNLRMRQATTIIVNFLIIIINQLESEDMFDKSS